MMHCHPYCQGWSGRPPEVWWNGWTHQVLSAGRCGRPGSIVRTEQKPVWAGELNTLIESLPDCQQAQGLERPVLVAIDEETSRVSDWNSHDVDGGSHSTRLDIALVFWRMVERQTSKGWVFKHLADAHDGNG